MQWTRLDDGLSLVPSSRFDGLLVCGEIVALVIPDKPLIQIPCVAGWRVLMVGRSYRLLPTLYTDHDTAKRAAEHAAERVLEAEAMERR